MTFLGWIAAVILFLQLPIPLYWFVMHPQVDYWRVHQKAGYITGLLLSWLPVSVLLVIFRRELFRATWPPVWEIAAGFALIICELWIFRRVHKDLGTKRLIGQTELSGGGQIEHRGIYSRIRHPIYTGILLAALGTAIAVDEYRALAALAAVMVGFVFKAKKEESFLSREFGPAFEEHKRHTGFFLPRFS